MREIRVRQHFLLGSGLTVTERDAAVKPACKSLILVGQIGTFRFHPYFIGNELSPAAALS